MSKLKYRLSVLPNDGIYTVSFRVLEMDERFRHVDGRNDSCHFTASNGLSIQSYGAPQLQVSTGSVFLRGYNKNLDDCRSYSDFPSKRQAEEYVAKVHAALREWAEKWPGFDPVFEV